MCSHGCAARFIKNRPYLSIKPWGDGVNENGAIHLSSKHTIFTLECQMSSQQSVVQQISDKWVTCTAVLYKLTIQTVWLSTMSWLLPPWEVLCGALWLSHCIKQHNVWLYGFPLSKGIRLCTQLLHILCILLLFGAAVQQSCFTLGWGMVGHWLHSSLSPSSRWKLA